MSETRFEALLADLEGISWDIVVVTETWREAPREIIFLEGGCTWYGSGGCKGRCGVGFLVNAHFPKLKFISENERLAMLDGEGVGTKVRVFAVYMPDGSHASKEVDMVYFQL